MATVRFGVIGLGTHGSRYANHLSAGDVQGAALGAVCRRNKQAGGAYAKEQGVKFYADYEALIADDDIDAVAVTTPTGQHMAPAVAAAKAGKHVLVEKPMACTVDECRQIIDAAASANVKLTVGQTFRYNALVMDMRERMRSLGKIVHMYLCQRQEPSKLSWHHSLEASGGGNLIENGVHLLDAVRWMSGQEVVSAYCDTCHLGEQETEDLFVAVLNLEDGCRCVVDACKYTQSRFGEIQIVGQEGQLIGSASCNTLFMVKGRDVEPIDPPDSIPGLPYALRDFVDAIDQDTDPPITGEDGLAVVAIAQACYESARTGRSVAVAQ